MKELEIKVELENGLHARPASRFVKCVAKCKSNVILIKNEKEYNPSKLFSLLSANIIKGENFKLVFDGVTEEEDMMQVKELVDSNFGE